MKTLTYRDLDTFTQQYCETALWSTMIYDENGNEVSPMDDDYGIEDIAPETIMPTILRTTLAALATIFG
jgi:uncharacterized membrane protein